MELHFPLILDGANGTELQKRGYDGKVSTEAWVLEHPEVMMQIQKEYADAGSDIVYAPTFGANSVKLEEHGIHGQTAEYNRRLAEVSRSAVGGRALVAADIAPTGKFLKPLGDVDFDELYEIYLEQVKALEDAGVDMFVIETIMTVPEARAALLAVKDVSTKPVLVSFTCDENGRTLTGTDICAALVIIQGMGADAFGLNCSTGPDMMLPQFRRLREYARVPLAVKPNAGLPEVEDGKAFYNCPPEEFVRYTQDFASCGAAMFGGCCGTGPEHILALKDAASGADIAKPAPAHVGKVVCATEKDAFVLEPGITTDRVLTCGAGLDDTIRRENSEDSPVIALKIDSVEDAEIFGAAQYAVRKPLCIVSDDAQALERALRLYQGRALYAGSLPDEELKPLSRKYGVIF